MVSAPIGLKDLQHGQGIPKEDNAVRSMSADFNVGCCCFQGFYFSFIVCGIQAGSKADFGKDGWDRDVKICLIVELLGPSCQQKFSFGGRSMKFGVEILLTMLYLTIDSSKTF